MTGGIPPRESGTAMYKDLLVPITATPGDDSAIEVALQLAAAFDARLSVLEPVNLPVPMSGPWGLMPDLAMTDIYSRIRAQAEINVARLRARLATSPVSSEVRLVEALFADPAQVAALQASYADLTIVAGMSGDRSDGDVATAYFGSLLLESGRPVLMVPPGTHTPLPARCVMVAWQPARGAARAVHDAMPLLQAAGEVDVLVVASLPDGRDHAARQGAALATHLSRHGVQARVVVPDASGRSIGALVLEHARASKAGLIVAGGYGHSRLREWAMGGVTRELLTASPLPVLFSH